MNAEQLNMLQLAMKVALSGPTSIFSAEVIETLKSASGLSSVSIRDCAQSIIVDAIARRGLFDEANQRRELAANLTA